MKKVAFILSIFLLGIGLITALFFLFGSEDRVNSVVEIWRRFKKDPAQICLDIKKERLKDPDSVRLLSYHWEDIPDRKERELHINFKAKNSYGAYVRDTDFCVIDEEELEKYSGDLLDAYISGISLATLSRELEKELEELKRQKEN
jgi:hypothetical protein